MRSLTKSAVSFVVASLALAGCPSHTPTDGAVDALGDGAGDSGADANDAPSADDTMDGGDDASDGGDDASTDAMPERTGRIVIAQSPGSTDSNPTATADAEFVETADGPRCPREMIDVCTVYVCPNDVVSAFVARRDAGVITVTGGTGTAITLTPDAQSIYPTVSTASLRWMANDMVTAAAAGTSDVPMFTQSVLFPTADMFTTPAAPAAGSRFVITRSSMIHVTWPDTSGPDDVLVRIDQQRTNDNVSIECRIPNFGGSLDLPAAALTRLDATTAGSPQTRIRIGTRASTAETFGVYVVETNADSYTIDVGADVN